MRWCSNSNFAAAVVIFLALPMFFLSAHCAAAANRAAVAGPNPRELGPLVSATCIAQLYTTPFDAFRHFRRCIQAWTEYDTVTCDPISPGSYNITQPAKHGTISNNIRGPFSLGNGDCPGHTYNFAFAYYNWTDDTENYDCLPHAPPTDDDTAACDLFTVDWVTPDGQFDMPFPMRANLAPRINGRKHVWWFKGETPAGYPTDPGITLTAYPPGYAYTWTIVTGGTEVKLSSPTANPVQVASLKGSTAINDVSITVQEAGGSTSNPFRLTVKQPKSLGPLATVDMNDATFAYLSYIHYKILDQFGKVLPKDVPVNEKWTATCPPPPGNSCPTADTPNDWRGSQNCGSTLTCPTLSPNDWNDVIGGETAGHVPTPHNPATPPPTAINHWDGKWSIGGVNPGNGVRVQTNTWQKYENHARHTNIVSPP